MSKTIIRFKYGLLFLIAMIKILSSNSVIGILGLWRFSAFMSMITKLYAVFKKLKPIQAKCQYCHYFSPSSATLDAQSYRKIDINASWCFN